MPTETDPDVVIHAGVPGLGYEVMPDGTGGYPSSAVDFIKLFRENGIAAEYDRPAAERSEVDHKAADLWLPVIEIVRDLAIGVLGNCIVALAQNARSRVHAKVGRTRNGETEWLETSGERDDVIAEINEFLDHKPSDDT